MEDPTDTIEYRGFTIEVHSDSDAQSPREDCEAWGGTMVCWHNRYNLGDEQRTDGPRDFMRDLACEVDSATEQRIDYWESDGYDLRGEAHSDSMIEKAIETAINKHVVILPLYLYDHSGITMSTGAFSCPWDSGQVGYIYMTRDQIKRDHGWMMLTKGRVNKIEGYLKGEVRVYDHFLTGNVYGYQVVDLDGDHLDSCWGYFGDDYNASGLLESAENAIDCHIASQRKAHFQQLKRWIKSKVPVQFRTPLELIYSH